MKQFFPTRTVVREVHVPSDQEIEDKIRRLLEVSQDNAFHVTVSIYPPSTAYGRTQQDA